MELIQELKKICKKEKIPLIGQIPFEREAAVTYSKGNLLVDEYPFKRIFKEIGNRLLHLLKEEV